MTLAHRLYQSVLPRVFLQGLMYPFLATSLSELVMDALLSVDAKQETRESLVSLAPLVIPVMVVTLAILASLEIHGRREIIVTPETTGQLLLSGRTGTVTTQIAELTMLVIQVARTCCLVMFLLMKGKGLTEMLVTAEAMMFRGCLQLRQHKLHHLQLSWLSTPSVLLLF